jgi:peptidylprolyl isomerase
MRSNAFVFLALSVLVFGGVAQAARPPIKALVTPPAPVDPKAVPAPGPNDWRTPDPENVLVIETNKGRVIVEMSPLAAPAAVERIRVLTRKGFYDGLEFFRVIEDFMDQTGDPQNTGTGSSTLPNLAPEFTFRRGADTPFAQVASGNGQELGFIGSLPVISQPLQLATFTADNRVNAYGDFCPGVGGMARAAALDSGNSQFFLMRGANESLNDNYTAWGAVISGLDVVKSIKLGEPPAAPLDKMVTVRLLADLPAATRLKVRVANVMSPWFATYVAAIRAQKPNEFSICDLTLPSEVK